MVDYTVKSAVGPELAFSFLDSKVELTANLRRLLSIHLRLWRASILIILLKILEITHSFMYSSHKPLTEERQWKVSRAGAGAVIRGHPPPHGLESQVQR